MASHSPTSFEQPVAIGPGSKEAGDPRLASWESWLFNRDSVNGFLVGSALFDVKGSLFSSVMVYGPQPVDFGLDLLSVLVGPSKLYAFCKPSGTL